MAENKKEQPVNESAPEYQAAPHQYALIRNLTPNGIDADSHRTLVAITNVYRYDAMVYREAQSVLDANKDNKDFDSDIRSFLNSVVNELSGRAKLYEDARNILERK